MLNIKDSDGIVWNLNEKYAMLLPKVGSAINYPNFGWKNGNFAVDENDLQIILSKEIEGKKNDEYAPWRIVAVPSRELTEQEGLPEEDPVDWIFRHFIWGGCALEEVPQGSAVETANFQADIIGNLKFARKIASRYFKFGTYRFDPHNQELIVGGIFGLIRARKAWSSIHGVPFRKFAVWFVKTGVRDVMSLERPIIIPNKIRLQLARVAKAVSKLIAEGKSKEKITADMINQRYYRDADAEPTDGFTINFKATADMVSGIRGYSKDELTEKTDSYESEVGEFYQNHLPNPLRASLTDEIKTMVKSVVAEVSADQSKIWTMVGMDVLANGTSISAVAEEFGLDYNKANRIVREFKSAFKSAWLEKMRGYKFNEQEALSRSK